MKALERIYRRRVPLDRIATPELIRSLTDASRETSRQVGALVQPVGQHRFRRRRQRDRADAAGHRASARGGGPFFARCASCTRTCTTSRSRTTTSSISRACASISWPACCSIAKASPRASRTRTTCRPRPAVTHRTRSSARCRDGQAQPDFGALSRLARGRVRPPFPRSDHQGQGRARDPRPRRGEEPARRVRHGEVAPRRAFGAGRDGRRRRRGSRDPAA